MLRAACVFCFALSTTALAADDPGNVLPPPRRVTPAFPVLPPPIYMSRNPYAVWQSYGVGRMGMWRPRVVYSPYGPYYWYNGEPFSWAPTRPFEFQPRIVAPPEGYGPPADGHR